jgi:hypothetical protein
VFVVTSIALFRHMVPMLALPEEPRRTGWLVVNYGMAAVASVTAILWLARAGLAVPLRLARPAVAPSPSRSSWRPSRCARVPPCPARRLARGTRQGAELRSPDVIGSRARSA